MADERGEEPFILSERSEKSANKPIAKKASKPVVDVQEFRTVGSETRGKYAMAKSPGAWPTVSITVPTSAHVISRGPTETTSTGVLRTDTFDVRVIKRSDYTRALRSAAQTLRGSKEKAKVKV